MTAVAASTGEVAVAAAVVEAGSKDEILAVVDSATISIDTAIEAHKEVVGKVTIDGILEVIEAITANSTTTQVEIVIGREVRLAERTLRGINLHFGELWELGELGELQNGNPFRGMTTRKMLLLQTLLEENVWS